MGIAVCHVLVADDSDVARHFVRVKLEKLGCKVEVAVDGMEAVKAVSNKHFDLILLDIFMPELDGMETLSRIRESQRDSADKSIIYAMTAGPNLETCIQAGFDGLLTKPINIDDLRKIAEDCLSRHKDQRTETVPNT